MEWILWSPSKETALIIIPEEAELLIPVIRAEKRPKVHLIAYAAPITKNMMHFNGLSYYVLPRLPVDHKIPDWFSLELGILAGRLYISFREVDTLTKYLQSLNKTRADQPEAEHTGGFAENPTKFLQEWLTLCRKGQDVTHTPMGYICQGRPLHENHPFFVTRSLDAGKAVMSSAGGTASDDVDEAEDGDTDHEDEWDQEEHIDPNDTHLDHAIL